jgi:hypothetical protein
MNLESRHIIARRRACGADTPEGHRWSNLDQQVENFLGAVGDQRVKLAKSIRETHDDLAKFAGQCGVVDS